MARLKRPASPATAVSTKKPAKAVDAARGDGNLREAAESDASGDAPPVVRPNSRKSPRVAMRKAATVAAGEIATVAPTAAAEAEREEHGEDQAIFDEKVSELFSELGELTGQRPLTSEEAQHNLGAVNGLIDRATMAMEDARGVDDSVMQLVLGEATKERELLLSEIYLLKMEEENQRVQVILERNMELRRREEEVRRMMMEEEAERKRMEEEEEERKKKEEDEERKKMEEEHRQAEASMLDKECKICFDEINDGVECSLCNNILGCKVCVDDWLTRETNECLFCRRPYTDVTQQVRRVGEKTPAEVKTPESAGAPTSVRRTKRYAVRRVPYTPLL